MTQAVPMTPLAVGPETAASMTGHARSAIYEALANGELKSFKSGRRRLILVTELSAWIEGIAKENAR